MANDEYHKLWSPYRRFTSGSNKEKFRIGDWARPEFFLLNDLNWTWTEKVNGTNARVMWDGHKPTFGGRTDNAYLPAPMKSMLRETFPEQLLEQQFFSKKAVLYGEAVGPNMSEGSGVYGREVYFILFDVKVQDADNPDKWWWLLPKQVENVADNMALHLSKLVFTGGIERACEYVRFDFDESTYGSFPLEGVVGRPPLGIMGRDGDRMLVKIKRKDFVGE